MTASLVVVVVIIGAMNFQYYCAMAARQADVRATANRLGLLLLESWKTKIGDVLIYDPQADFNLLALDEFTPIADPGIPGLGNPFKFYRIEVNRTKFFVKLSYADDIVAPSRLRTLNIAIAWSRNYGSDTLDFESRRLLTLTNYANFVVNTP
jgi:hypothetical protein